jgi:hypothetical protein
MSGARTRTARAVALLAVLALAAAACQPTVTFASGSPFEAFMLTPDGADHVDVSGTPADVTVAMPAENTGTNTRAVWWDPSIPEGLNVAACVTWASATHEPHQPGVALWRENEGGLTVTRNVWDVDELGNHVGPRAWTGLNVHRWDVQHDPGDGHATDATFTLLGSARLPGITASDGGPKAYPWRACVMSNWTVFRFKVWAEDETEPAWDDPAYGYAVGIPADMQMRPRRPGWYDGHGAPGESARYTAFDWAIVE